MEYKIVEARGALCYYSSDSGELLCEDTEDILQCFWVVKYDPENKEIVDWEEMFSTPEAAEEALMKMKGE